MAQSINAQAPAAHAQSKADDVYVAYQILHWGFTVLPIIAGLDKFFSVLTNWTMYLAPVLPRTLHLSAHLFMMIAGVIEIVAGILVGLWPRVAAYIVALWLLGIIVNLLLLPGYYDIALRDFGLLLAALSLGSLARFFDSGARARAEA
ncbi:MAG TPA: hypothetical protein VGS41_02705 [Chthonomonadales bacterium]|nr:hypothetical protein [Chthonomonadales bacterium]